MLAVVGTLYFVIPYAVLPSIYMEVLTVIALFLRGAGLGILTINALSGLYSGLTKSQMSHASVNSRIIVQLSAAIGSVFIILTLFAMAQTLEKEMAYTLIFIIMSFISLVSIIPINRIGLTSSKVV